MYGTSVPFTSDARDVGRRAVGGERPEAVPGHGPIRVVHPALHTARLVERRAERVAGDELEGVGLAQERHFVRSGEDGPLRVVVDESEAHQAVARGILEGQCRRARLEAVDEGGPRAVRSGAQRRGHVALPGV